MFLNFNLFIFFPTPPHALTFTPGMDEWLAGKGVVGVVSGVSFSNHTWSLICRAANQRSN